MIIRPLCLLAAIVLATIIPSGSAFAAATVAPPRIHGLVVKDTPSRTSDRQPATRTPKAQRDEIPARSSRAATRMNDRRQFARFMLIEDRARQHEQAQVEERAKRIYATSQVSAPILLDTSACRRVGAHGESIYENCALTAANAPSR